LQLLDVLRLVAIRAYAREEMGEGAAARLDAYCCRTWARSESPLEFDLARIKPRRDD